ncbi:zinc finger and BTB domain-containing 1 isoform X1 [Pelobates cultripes]|uniref:Zinc finger and BTB domain-containing 1 isoform X1 n=2 Tax=Pelobates cultripes TaxID=61616 RepID=A0AAD1TL65_PELCU|nr:zinc finger and BTB domain-containing 1 isoform X1 [Pelobates cultripes]
MQSVLPALPGLQDLPAVPNVPAGSCRKNKIMERASHCSYVLQQLYSQREWGFLCDCCIAIEDIYFQAHKAVLAACSSYFKMMFINQQHAGAQLNLSSTKISAECFDLILQFMYLGKILTAPEDFEQLRNAMSYLQLYVIPGSLEDIQDLDNSSFRCSSSASSSVSSKMVFGVRMYEETISKSGEEPSRWTSEPSLSMNVLQEKKVDVRKQTHDACKKTPLSKVSNTRERVSRRFGRSYTCDSCGFVFSCEKLLDEHVQTCTNRHSYQSKESCSSDQNERDSPNPKLSPSQDNGCKVDSSQSIEESLSSTSTKNSGVTLGQLKNSVVDTTVKNPVIIKIESDENSLVEMDDINIVKISDKDFLESSDIDDLEDEPDESLRAYYVSEDYNKNAIESCIRSQLSTNSQQKDIQCRKNMQYLNQKLTSEADDSADTVCELCGLPITEEDLSSHYLSKHLENICACGKCGQILVKGRQLQEHAQRCGVPPDQMESDNANNEERIHFDDHAEEPSTAGDVVVDMWTDIDDRNIPKNDNLKKQLYKHAGSPFRCPNCGQRFESENLVVEHMSQCLDNEGYRNSVLDENDRDHRRKHFCNICGKGFYQRCHLREHFTVHTKEKQFSCQTCGKQFLRERQLRLHNDMHTGMARYVCSVCEQGNFRKHDHVRHMISHLAAGETICQVCFQIFPNNDLLSEHMDIHLYTCGVCGAKFNLRKDMRFHYNSKHFKKN